jgi:hypothetical protein
MLNQVYLRYAAAAAAAAADVVMVASVFLLYDYYSN